MIDQNPAANSKIPEFFTKKYWIMLSALARSDFKMRDQGSIFGFLWTLFNPLLSFSMFYFIFGKFFSGQTKNYPVFLIIGIVQYNFFSSASSSSVTAIWRYAQLIKNIKFHKSILILATIESILVSHILELITMFVFIFIVQKQIPWTMIGLFPILLINIYLVISVAFVLSTIGVYFIDIARIWGILMGAGIFLTPIFYSIDSMGPQQKKLLLMNPITHIVMASRTIVIDKKIPELNGLIYVIVLSTIIFLIGYNIFKRKEGYFVEKIS